MSHAHRILAATMNARPRWKAARLFVAVLVAVMCVPAISSSSDEPTKAEKPAADSILGKEAGEVRDDNGLKLKLVWCPPGVFTMDNLTEQSDGNGGLIEKTDPVRVFLTRGYWLGKYEVTQAEWNAVMETKPWKGQAQTEEGDDFPVAWIDWDEATAFCRKLTERERKAGRLPDGWEYTLPTEAQWERACRARIETAFSFGDDKSKLGEYAWYGNAIGEQYAHRVGKKRPNPWGLYDMHGNVMEWCQDHFAFKLPDGRDPDVPEGLGRVSKGGSFFNDAAFCRSAYRQGNPPSRQSNRLGLRIALTVVRPAK